MNRVLHPEPRHIIITALVFGLVVFSRNAYSGSLYWLIPAVVFALLLVLAIYDVTQKKHAIPRNFPVIGRLRYLLESIRPELRQYFFESDLDGRPFNRRQRSIVYQRSKNQRQTVAFGMQGDPGMVGYEWVNHSIFPVKVDGDLRVTIGNHQCSQPYNASILNIGAMSYGALSHTAIRSLNGGAFLGGFAHNTGEGGISDHHLQGGDLIWQIGTGYFGCRTPDGKFSPDAFRKKAALPSVKMIELKLSQGAKPGHGGILPAAKNTPEIARMRLVEPGITVHSPASHSAFSNPGELMFFLGSLRELSNGKPVGFKLCVGSKQEFEALCEAMIETGVIPDFITVDGSEGGTGAAPLEFIDHIGMPLSDALSYVKQTLKDYSLDEDIKIIAAGKIITGYDILKALSLGASACYSARGMMMALGCIQALLCDSGRCPVGIATQNRSLAKGIDVADKKVRVFNFHRSTIQATKEIMEACAFGSPGDVKPSQFFKRISTEEIRSFEEIYFKHGKRIIKKIDPTLN